MFYKERIEEDKLKQIMEQNISYLDHISEQIKLGYISVFAGAGLSVASGYVDWKRLLEPLCKQMRLDINKDLTEIAQYYKNQYGRQGLNDIVFNEFAKIPKNNENVAWLAKLPIKEYWTTNYDHIIEQEIQKRGKVVETIISQESFKYHDPRREVVIYKMHGDKDYPDDVVLTKEDYQKYDDNRKLFTRLLSVELVRRTFVFIGFSFNDPNLERILSIAKNTLNSKSLPKHYCFMRKVQIIDYLDNNNLITNEALERYIQDKNYQELRIDDMRKYGIYTILVDDFKQITIMLQYIYNKYITNNVFVSGGINPDNLSDYGEFNQVEYDENDRLSRAERFLTLLGKALVDNDFQIYTGFGAGVGNYILSGVLESKKKNPLNIDIISNEIHINSLIGVEDDLKDKIRRRMLGQCSSTIILFGESEEKKNSGITREYKIASENENYIIPVRSTGFAARKIYDDLKKRKQLPDDMEFLETEENIKNLVDAIVEKLSVHRREKEINLKEQLFSSIAMYGIGVFISYHYDSDNKIAKEITDIINTDKINIFTVVKENQKEKDAEIIKSWVDEEIKKTRITILLISAKTLDREYVTYELSKSLSNGNTIIPILIDSKENAFGENDIDTIEKKLNKELPDRNLRIRKWFQDNGKENILRWLNESLDY
ncbi:SIR2 family protein [Merdimonas faecis]|uniref:SIR2 family protein n=1 Tax=Merdimonas faecis TaxID=1653435 RepID=UPI0022E00A0E|nr:SIR2 family protein [Merdimonas faecis]